MENLHALRHIKENILPAIRRVHSIEMCGTSWRSNEWWDGSDLADDFDITSRLVSGIDENYSSIEATC